ncbi:MAG: hypothetical protein ACI97N_001687 [Cognaticolwellia sp.]|jgi:hypothetical protein
MLTIRYNQTTSALANWKDGLETLVMAHEFVQDSSIEQPILKTQSETVIGEIAISKYMDELAEFKKVWFHCDCK